MLGRQPGDFRVVTGPADDNALVVDVIGPRPRVFAVLADVVVHLIAIGDDGVGRHVADAPPGGSHDVGQIARQRLTRGDSTGEEDLVAPDAHLDLAIGAGIGLVALGHDGVGDLVAELVRMSREHDFAHADHDGNLDNCV